MQNKETDAAPLHVEPILAVKDIKETIEYWHAVLGFPSKWTWGEPPNYGGVNWNSTSVQFNLAPELASASKGNAIFIKVKNWKSCINTINRKRLSSLNRWKINPGVWPVIR